jgi:hypothetical protein
LERCIRLSLRTRALDCYDYLQQGRGARGEGRVQSEEDNRHFNPLILHRKETFLHPSHPLYTKFAGLTQQEEKAGLLADPATIGTRTGWLTRLQAHRLTLRGHRLVRQPQQVAPHFDATPSNQL